MERSGIRFTLAWQMRVDPHNLLVKRLLAEGRFGKVFMVRRRHCLSTQRWKDFDRSWHVQPEFNRDIFADDAAHALDFIYWLLGMPQTVVAEMGSLLNPRIPNDNAIAVFRYADGRFAEASCSFAAVAGENTLEVVCQNGTIIGNCGDMVSCAAPRLEPYSECIASVSGVNPDRSANSAAPCTRSRTGTPVRSASRRSAARYASGSSQLSGRGCSRTTAIPQGCHERLRRRTDIIAT